MDFSRIGEHAAKHDAVSRQEVPDRALQYDADFACYEVANLDEPPSKNFRALLRKIDTLRRLSGSQWVNAHVTMGEKSGRESMATVKQYQENRDPDAPIKMRVRALRLLLANMKHSKEFPRIRPAASFFREADDTMCTMQSLRIAELGKQSSIIMSGDKDLWMVQGLHCDPKDGRIWEVSGYGKTEYRDVGNVKPKLVGEGTSWFWHQMIMGDSADNIPGLERLDHAIADHYLPLKTGKARKDGNMACAEAKATLISPFVGRILDWYKASEGRDYQPSEDPGVLSVKKIYNYYKNYNYKTEVMGASFRNKGEILELAGCDLLTISPNLLAELSSSNEIIKRKLSVEESKLENIERLDVSEKNFRWEMNEDAMATEKTADGIRQFSRDIRILEEIIKERILQ